MKEIKFRGWDLVIREWVYGYFYTFGERAFIIEPGKPGIPEQHIEVVPESVCQYTGLKDKTGKEIYKDDIVFFYGDNEKYQIGWNIEHTCWALFKDNESVKGCSAEDETGIARWYEVFGNVYENPELLKQ